MKNFFYSLFVVCITSSALVLSSSCNKDDDDKGANDAIFGPTENPLGKSYKQWAQDYYNTVMLLNCDEIYTPHVVSMDEDVAIFHFVADTFTEHISISHNKALLISIASWLNDYPCPDSTFEPAPGQTLEAFLQEGANGLVASLENIKVAFDGDTVENIDNYIFISDLFNFTANPELTDCFDPCITGQPQPGVVGGYFVMFKEMKKGTHTIFMHGEIPSYSYIWNTTVNITVD